MLNYLAERKGGKYMKESGRTRFYLDKTGFFAESAVILLAMAIIFRVIGCIGMWGNRVDAIMLVLLPVLCCMLLILCVLLLGKKGFFLSFIPVLLGVVFFVFKSLSFESWMHTVLCVILYVVVAVIYTATVIGWIHTKWLLPPLFGLPFLYHVAVEDIPALIKTPESVSFAKGMQEMSVLCIMAALFCIGMGLKKRPPKQKKSRKEATEPAEAAPIQAAPMQPAPVAPVAETPVIQSAAVESAGEENPILSDAPYTPVLTLNPDPLEPEDSGENKTDDSDNE